jgi:hypothetical protein
MALFKSREERRIERNLEVRKGINAVKRTIANLERNERDYLQKAKRAKSLGSGAQLNFLKQTLKKTMSQRILMERQLLNIETAIQIKDQAEAHAQFAKSMTAISKTIGEMFAQTDLAKTQVEFEKAMQKAQTMEEQMELFLDIGAQSMFGSEGASSSEIISDKEIDNLINEEVAHDETAKIDEDIAGGIKEIQEELGREEK